MALCCDLLILHDGKENIERWIDNVRELNSKVKPTLEIETWNLLEKSFTGSDVACGKILCLFSDVTENLQMVDWKEALVKFDENRDWKRRVLVVKEAGEAISSMRTSYFREGVSHLDIGRFDRFFLWWFDVALFMYGVVDSEADFPSSDNRFELYCSITRLGTETTMFQADFPFVAATVDIIYQGNSKADMLLAVCDNPVKPVLDMFRKSKINQREVVLLVTSPKTTVTKEMRSAATQVFSFSQLLEGVLYVLLKCGKVSLELECHRKTKPPPPLGPIEVRGNGNLYWKMIPEHEHHTYSLQGKQGTGWKEVERWLDPYYLPYVIFTEYEHYRLLAEDEDGTMSEPIYFKVDRPETPKQTRKKERCFKCEVM